MLKRGFSSFLGKFAYLHGFRSSMLYSTLVARKDRITGSPLAEFLVKSVGFSEEEAISIATHPKVSHPSKSNPSQPELVVDFLKTSGFEEIHIRRLVTSSPRVLRCKVEQTLQPKLGVFQNLGLSGPDLGLLVSQHPILFHRSLKAHIVPSIEMLKSLIGSNEQLVAFLLKTTSQGLFFKSFRKYMPRNLLFMKSYGVPSGKIKQLMLKKPLLLLQRTQRLEKIVKVVKEELGISPNSAMFVHGISALSTISEKKLKSCFQLFHSHGWSETEILRLGRRLPYAYGLSGKLLRVKLKYFMEDLGFGSDYLASRPVLLLLSMEKRIVPRTAVIQALKEKQLLKSDASFYSIMGKPESRFVDKYVLPFKDKLPQLYESYTQQTSSGGSLSKT